jgi:hypothetical protein
VLNLSSMPTIQTKKKVQLAGRWWLTPAILASYSRGRDLEDHGSKPVQEKSSQGPISKIPITKRADEMAPGVGPEF